MCLGIPMVVMEIDGFNVRCEAKGIERTASLWLLQHEQVNIGDNLMIHLGYATQKMTAEQAQSAWEIYDEMLTSFDPQQTS